jgi:D-tagatose-1,6-bisphosphate aldolase subunit GatZ/KbaZ
MYEAMSNKITVAKMMQAIYKMEEKEARRCTMLGIGPMSEPVIRASFELAKEKKFPLLFIASRNQIDARKFGGGYVRGWDQKDFVKALQSIADEAGFDGLYYVCRDHGGPWQRDKERSDKLPTAQAMAVGKESYLEDLLAGFDLLHIDPTKDPHIDGIIPMDIVLERTVELIEYVETERKARGLAPISYEVGTEETNGGLTSDEAYATFIRTLSARLSEKGLPMPVFIVGQTGTLTRMTENVGKYNTDAAMWLSSDARKFGVGLKEHNGDYLCDELLYLHPVMGVTATNVAPEYGVAETAAYLELAKVENFLVKQGKAQPSGFVAALREASVRCERWRKWMVGADTQKSVDEVLRDDAMTDLITRTGGHYTFEEPQVKAALGKMFETLRAAGLCPERSVVDSIKRSIGRYAECFQLTGITEKIFEYADKE